MKDLTVGIIGVASERSWGREAHVPGVHAVDGLTLAAVATRDQHSADTIAAAVGALRGYGDPHDLIADPNIDIVTVATPVPTHHDLIVEALRAGKHVVTEWPVAPSTAQTGEIAAVADQTGMHTAVGLQSRANPVAIRARELVQSGAIGRILYATVFSSTAGFGATIPAAARSLEDPAVGMNLTTIQTAHTLDFAVWLTGPLRSLAALGTVQYPQLRVDDGSTMHRTVPDHLLAQCRLEGGGALAVQVVGGRPPGQTPFRMDVVGEDGTITLSGGADRGFQAGLLELSLNGDQQTVNDQRRAPSVSAYNVSRVYAALRKDIEHDTRNAPSFAHAVELSRLVGDLLTSTENGCSITPTAA